MTTSAFTCTGPYAILIMLGIKRVENRSVLPVPVKGRCAIGCSKSFCKEEYGNFVQWASRTLSSGEFATLPAWNDVKDWPGTIVGACDYEVSDEKPFQLSADGVSSFGWDEGYPYWWRLSNVVCFDRPIPCRGNVGMWQMPSELAVQVAASDTLAQCVSAKVTTASEAARWFRLAVPLAGAREGFFVLPLDAEGCALSAPVLVSLGDSTTTVVRPGDVFAIAFRTGAVSMVLAHNHPSGNPAPSLQDRELTKVMSQIGEGIGIRIVDHLVIGDEGFCSVLEDAERCQSGFQIQITDNEKLSSVTYFQ